MMKDQNNGFTTNSLRICNSSFSDDFVLGFEQYFKFRLSMSKCPERGIYFKKTIEITPVFFGFF